MASSMWITYLSDAPSSPLWFDGGVQITLRLAQQITGDCRTVIRNPGTYFTERFSSEILEIWRFIDNIIWCLNTRSP